MSIPKKRIGRIVRVSAASDDLVESGQVLGILSSLYPHSFFPFSEVRRECSNSVKGSGGEGRSRQVEALSGRLPRLLWMCDDGFFVGLVTGF